MLATKNALMQEQQAEEEWAAEQRVPVHHHTWGTLQKKLPLNSDI
jgi:hypothetical protein